MPVMLSRLLEAHELILIDAHDAAKRTAELGDDGTNDLIVSDVIMPEMDGPTMLVELRKRGLAAKIVFVSGYAGQTVLDHKVVDVENNFLQKPFTLIALAIKVREILDMAGRDV